VRVQDGDDNIYDRDSEKQNNPTVLSFRIYSFIILLELHFSKSNNNMVLFPKLFHYSSQLQSKAILQSDDLNFRYFS
jgi:hypothetical protein